MTTMDNNSIVPPPYSPKHHAMFRCIVDNRMYKWPVMMWCLFEVFILIVSPTLLWGLFAVLWSVTPFVMVVFLSRYLWKKTTYTITDDILRVSTPLKSLDININSVKKIRRGKFWVERVKISLRLTSSFASSMIEVTMSMYHLKMRNHSLTRCKPSIPISNIAANEA